MQYLLKSLVTKKARDAIEGIDAVAEAYPEAIAALKARFDRPQIIHRAHARALLNAKPVKDGSSSELRQLYDTFQHHLRSLKAQDKLDFDRFMTALGESKLDPQTMIEWQKFTQAEKDVPSYTKFLEFLDLRATTTELTSFDANQRKTPPINKKPKLPSKFEFNHAITTQIKCLACNGQKHSVAYCQTFKEKSLTEKRAFVLEKGLCLNCLKGKHKVKQCPSPHSCLKCGKRHHTLLHVDDVKPPERKPPEPPKPPTSSNSFTSSPSLPATNNLSINNSSTNSETNTSHSYVATPRSTHLNAVLMMTAEVIVSSPTGEQMRARALLDPASTASFVTERVAQHLKLRRSKQKITINGIGGSQCSTQSNSVVNINLKSTQSTSTLSNVEAIVLQSLTRCLPVVSITEGYWPHLSSLKLADPEFNISKQIDILLGVSAYHEILKPGLILGPKGTPSAQETLFGWVLFGNANASRHSMKELVTTLHVSAVDSSCEETLQKFWTLEEPPKPKVPASPAEKLALQHYNQHLKHEKNGRFVVKLPFKPQKSALGESRPLALRRFLSLERRLRRSDQFEDYANVVNEYISFGHAERVPDADLNKPPSNTFYLAHHAVYKDSATTPLRVVFDGSMKTSSGVSLNDQLLVGPTVHSPLNDVLIRFRRYSYVLTTDVSKMYRGVGLAAEDRDYHRFLWRENPTDPVVDYRMTRVTFGIASAAFLATYSLSRLAEENQTKFPLAAKAVKESFYVDDGLPSVQTKQEAILLQRQLQDLFASGGLKLHKWDSNSTEVLNSIPPEIRSTQTTSKLGDSDHFVKTLGMEYNSSQDYFRFSSTNLTIDQSHLTKRSVLSDSAKIFDPLGLISCVTIVVKIIFQQLWKRGIDWDEPLPPDIQRHWISWRECLFELSNLRISRCYAPIHCQIVHRHLVGFSDASEVAYSGVVYLRSIDTIGEVHISLVMAKTRVAPIKKVTLPRLELCGALLLAQIMSHLQGVLSIPMLNSFAYTDSSIVLYWIYGTSHRFKTFEANRISKIQDLIPPERWRHVDGLQNPADVGSRGILANEIKEHQLWWSGPAWMKENPSNWPSKFTVPPSIEDLQSLGITKDSLQLKGKEEVTMQITTDAVPMTEPVIDINRYSSYSQLVRTLAWVFRVVTRSNLFSSTPLSVSELFKAKAWLIKQAQAQVFPTTIKTLRKKKPLPSSDHLQSLNPFLDKDGLLRVGGRLSQSMKAYESRHP